MNMNQSEFSKRLDVSFATVNRWENGHATPGRQAQEKLYALCGEQKVPMDNMIFAKIRKMAEGLQIAPDRQILYHGSKSGISGHIAPKSRRQCDFGKGFYMGTDPAQALTLICDYEYAKFYIVSIDVKQLAVPVLAHRLMLQSQSSVRLSQSSEALIGVLLSKVPVPTE